ncbi:MAG TPA: hypothetical protein VN729_05425, partial [Ktedonobacteraceae bacterium]|nr:hypothetical protein [Ktedonobacteraceae bacterium]
KQPVLPGVTPEDLDATFTDPDAIGWAYQFYQAEARGAINAKCKNGGKVSSRAELVAKTQLFTEPYMVQWLLQNSLGRSYAEAYPQSTLPATWPYALQPEQQETQPEHVCELAELTLLDPCMGGGHFLRAAFDLFASMYREQHPEMEAATIAERVLGQHLFGIDLDPRSAQISALTLYLRAWEFAQAGSANDAAVLSVPPAMHLASVPTNLARGSLQRHLQRYPQDAIYAASLEKIFEDLEQSEMLGSLLHISAYLEDLPVAPPPQHTKTTADPSQTRKELLAHIVASCRTEKETDANPTLLGHEITSEMHPLQLLEKRYAVIATNPPYLDSRDMHEALRKYIATRYPTGKRDLYAAFLLRCFDLCQPLGRVAVVTMQSWLFNRSFAELRAAQAKETTTKQKKSPFRGILREMCIETLVHLGAHAFEGIAGEIVQCAMLTFSKRVPAEEFRINAWRLVGLRNGEEKRAALLSIKAGGARHIINRPRQRSFLSLAEAPIVYDLSDDLTRLLAKGEKLQQIAHVRQGLATADNARFTRCHWEILSPGAPTQNELSTNRWFRYAKGGCYQKWAGLMWLVVDWEYSGQRIKLGLDAQNRPRFRDNAPQFAFQTGLTYTFIASGSFGTRILSNALFDVAGTSLFPKTERLPLSGLAAVTSSHVVSYLLRILTQDLKFNAGYVANTPLAPNISWQFFRTLGELCIKLKSIIVAQNIIEDAFAGLPATPTQHIQAILHTVEGWNEQAVCATYQLSQQDRQAVIDETGTPAGWYPLLAGYDTLPDLSDELEGAPKLPEGLYAYLAMHPRLILAEKEMSRVKAKLRALYEAGPRAKQVGSSEKEQVAIKNEQEMSAGARIAIPAETFLEALSIKMQLHPISVYWLLEDLQASENVHCLPEERRLLEDRLSVLVLRLLGHRWPQQIEHFEPLPEWAETSGIIPLVPCAGQQTLLERVRERLHSEEGASRALEFERQVRALTGQHLEQWLRGSFFERHISQFKQRPIAWQLVSTPTTDGVPGKSGLAKSRSSRTPAFACLIYYHACSNDILTKIRVQYIEPLLQKERGLIDTTTGSIDKAASFALERVRELEEFAIRLRTIEEQGFACHELQESGATETLDCWSGNGQSCPESRNAYLRAEAAWQIDINDGVRVNIAPLQLAGILARRVLHPKDARKALSDRVRWRAEERRWVRAGKLPRCGWMDPLCAPMADSSAGQSKLVTASDQRASREAAQQMESAR